MKSILAMSFHTRSELRSSLFTAMRKCTETYSSGRMLENVTQTRNLMSAFNEFYQSNPSEEELITMQNVTSEELEIATSFFNNNHDRLPIDTSVGWDCQKRDSREFAFGFAAFRADFMPQFRQIIRTETNQQAEQWQSQLREAISNAIMNNELFRSFMAQCAAERVDFPEFIQRSGLHFLMIEGSRIELGNALFEAMNDRCDDHWSNDLLEIVFSSKKALQTTAHLLQSVVFECMIDIRSRARQELFEAMEMCSQSFSERLGNNKIYTHKLMSALSAFYLPNICEEEQVRLDNLTDMETQIISSFVNDNSCLPFSIINCDLYGSKNCSKENIRRVIASGFAALRFHFMPRIAGFIREKSRIRLRNECIKLLQSKNNKFSRANVVAVFEKLLNAADKSPAELQDALFELIEKCSRDIDFEGILDELCRSQEIAAQFMNEVIDEAERAIEKESRDKVLSAIKEFYRIRSPLEGTLEWRRQKVFQAMNNCCQAHARGDTEGLDKYSNELLTAVNAFYLYLRAKKDTITLKNSNPEERRIAKVFMQRTAEQFPVKISGKGYTEADIRNAAAAFAALRLDLMPQFAAYVHPYHIRRTFLFIGIIEKFLHGKIESRKEKFMARNGGKEAFVHYSRLYPDLCYLPKRLCPPVDYEHLNDLLRSEYSLQD